MNLLRRIAERTAAEDQAMIEAGYEIESTGPLGGRTYRLSAETVARRRAEAEDEHIRQMAQRAKELYALAFPQQAAEQIARQADHAYAEPCDAVDAPPATA